MPSLQIPPGIDLDLIFRKARFTGYQATVERSTVRSLTLVTVHDEVKITLPFKDTQGHRRILPGTEAFFSADGTLGEVVWEEIPKVGLPY